MVVKKPTSDIESYVVDFQLAFEFLIPEEAEYASRFAMLLPNAAPRDVIDVSQLALVWRDGRELLAPKELVEYGQVVLEAPFNLFIFRVIVLLLRFSPIPNESVMLHL